MSRKNDKRNRLIEAADELIYKQTFNSTTLANIATKAAVPLGNVYYYFKTKDDILKAVVQKRSSLLQEFFTSVEQQFSNPKDRLSAFITHSTDDSETTAQYGCALGSLCQELGKITGELAPLASELMHSMLDWVEGQFKALGKGERSLELARYLVASIQGGSLLTLTFKDPNFIKRQSASLERWLETA